MKSEEWICTKEKYFLLNYGGKNMMIRPFVGGLGVLLTIEQQDNRIVVAYHQQMLCRKLTWVNFTDLFLRSAYALAHTVGCKYANQFHQLNCATSVQN